MTHREEFTSRAELDVRLGSLKARGHTVHKATDQVLRNGSWRMVWILFWSES